MQLHQQNPEEQEEITPVTLSETADVSAAAFAPMIVPPPRLAPDEAERAQKLLQGLSSRSAIRYLAEQTLQGEPIETVEPLLNVMQNADLTQLRKYELAAWTLGRALMPEEQKPLAIQTLREMLRWRLDYNEEFGRFAGIFGAVMGGYALLTVLSGHNFWLLRLMAAMFLIVFCAHRVVLLSFRRHLYQMTMAAAHALENLHAAEAVGELAQIALQGKASEQEAACRALETILPELTPAHHGTIGSQVTGDLLILLRRANWQLSAKILDALACIGDSRAIGDVERFAYDPEKRPEVRDAAQRALKQLRQRQEQEQNSSVLLRAAGEPMPTAPEELLRASQSVETSHSPEELLRGSSE